MRNGVAKAVGGRGQWRGLHVLSSVADVRAYRRDCTLRGKAVGFVPTMGALHEGHIQLMKDSKSQNHITMASIFVNPTQFSAGEDLDKYPRQLAEDLSKLRATDVDAVFVPEGREMYARWPV
jgi:pantoate--beta-alanine ligase